MAKTTKPTPSTDKTKFTPSKETKLDLYEHKLSLDEIVKLFATDLEKGLSSKTAQELLLQNGPNALTPPKKSSNWTRFLKHVVAGFNLLLLIAAILTYIAYVVEGITDGDWMNENLFLGSLLLLVVLLMGSLTYYQEIEAAQLMESFVVLVPPTGHVIRDGVRIEIVTADVVVGDIVEVSAGDKIPCDLYIVESNTFKVDNSSLTGESEPQARSPGVSNSNPLETKNLAFFSTFAVEGNCRGVAIRTGDMTAMGKVAKLTSSVPRAQKPIEKDLDKFVTILSIVSVTLGILCFVTALALKFTWVASLLLMISLFVGSVPDGLMPSVVIALSLAAKRLAKKNIVVKDTDAVETLGSTTVICSDKTGTLTQNRMAVSHLWFDGEIAAANTSEFQTGSEKASYDTKSLAYTILLRECVLCNRAEFKLKQGDIPVMQQGTIGDASESAFLKFAKLRMTNYEAVRKKHKKVCEIPFTSVNKYQVSIHEIADPKEKRSYYFLLMKGAPEKIIKVCSTMIIKGDEVRLSRVLKDKHEEACRNLANEGERVLGFCQYYLPSKDFPKGYPFNSDEVNFPLSGFCFIGLISLIDPPRANVADSVAKCRLAGIKVVMITGDHPITAKAIAKKVGIISKDAVIDEGQYDTSQSSVEIKMTENARACVIHGNALKSMSTEDIDGILLHYKELVFARTSPQHKLMITESFQRLGHIVAVTGDGVNDAPALKKADIGIAMGITGSEVSKLAADVILLDDNFASIITGIEEGRLIYDNLKKTIAFGLTTAVNHELAAMTVYVVLGTPSPIGTTQMLLVGLGTDILPAIALSYEGPESDIMARKPRDPRKETLVTRQLLMRSYLQIGFIETAGAFFSVIVVMVENGFYVGDLIGIQSRWNSPSVNDVTDSYGQEWSYEDRKKLEYTCHTAFFVACVITQVGNVIVNKCRRNSILQQGMRNRMLNISIVTMLLMAVIACYVPGMTLLHLYPLKWQWWLSPIPFFFAMIIYDEFRRYLIRKYPGSYIERETYV